MAAIIQKILSFITSVIAVITATFGGFGNGKVENFKVTTYLRGDNVYSAADLNSADFDIITDLIIFECADFNSKGEIVYDEAKMERVMSAVRSVIGDRDIHITLNLLGPRGVTDSDVWEDQMKTQSEEHNKAFRSGVLEDNIKNILDKYDFDGVHFDYEYPITDDAWYYFNSFLVSLRRTLQDEYTIGVAAGAWNFFFTLGAISAIDTLELMTYDYVDANGRHATYEDTVAQIEQLKNKGIPAKKINIGLPFYSRPTDMTAYWYGYNTYYDEITDDGWYHCDETNKDFWFNTPEVISQKTQYAIDNGYGGVMIWHYSCDLPSSHEGSLLRAIGETKDKNY
ncbi:MAG: hypothetical protein IJE48_06810 [Clostridia bacterium]|nr:hypothetical protein [Clostridia bacterium]